MRYHNNKKYLHIAPASGMKGFSLIELLVASILSMVILIAVSSGYFSVRQLSEAAGNRLDAQQDLRNAANMIVRDARMAGSFGCFNMATNTADKITSDGADNGAAIWKLKQTGADSLVPIKAGGFSAQGFTVSRGSVPLIFQYGVGSTSLNASELKIPGGDPLESATSNTPLVFSSCNALDRPASFTITRAAEQGNQKITISDVTPALSAEHNGVGLMAMRYIVNAYVVGTPANGETGLYRFQLEDGYKWSNPQLLVGKVSSMQIQYGYASCEGTEKFEFTGSFKTGETPALLRIRLNVEDIEEIDKLKEGKIEVGEDNNLFNYNIDAAVRGGNVCANRVL